MYVLRIITIHSHLSSIPYRINKINNKNMIGFALYLRKIEFFLGKTDIFSNENFDFLKLTSGEEIVCETIF